MDCKTWRIIGIGLLFLFVLNVDADFYVSSSQTGRTVDDIVNESWNRLIASGKITVAHELKSKNDKRKLSHGDIHNHGECASQDWMRRQEELLLKNPLVKEFQDSPSTHSSSHKRNTQAMRFFVNTDVMASGSDPQACYTVGQVIQIAFYTCDSSDLLTEGLLSLIQDSIIPTMLQIFSEVLSVKDPMYPLKLDLPVWFGNGGECDTAVPIPQSYVSQGINNTDYILFVTARPTQSQNTVAYAGGCNFKVINNANQVYSRPYAGILNLNPRWFQSYVTSMSLYEYKKALKIAMHEVTHALGFTSFFYKSYLDSGGSLYNPSVWFAVNTTGTAPSGQIYNQTIQKLRGPNLLSFARDYFNCTSLDGVELEDYGGSGTAGSHWERRVCGEEYMTGFVSDQMWMSGFTLSLFEDMGWYNVDRSKVEYIGWGKDQGCPFVQSRCESSWPTADPGYWCTNTIDGCTADRVGVGSCYINFLPSSPSPYYQHFSNPSAVGIDPAADYCAYTYPWTSCRDTGKTPQSGFFEVYGDNSRCWEVASGASTTLVCYPYQCTTNAFNATILQVQINSTWVTCPTQGGTVSVTSIFGGSTTVNCPKTSLFCRVVDGFQTQVLITDTLLLSTPSRSPSPSTSVTPSVTPSHSPSPSITPTPSVTPSSSATPTRTPSVTPSHSPSPSITPTVTPTATPTMTPYASASPTPSPTSSPSATPSPTPSGTPIPSSSTSSIPDDTTGSNAGGDHTSGFTIQSAGFIATVVVIGTCIVLSIGGVVAWGRRSQKPKAVVAEGIDLPTLWKALE